MTLDPVCAAMLQQRRGNPGLETLPPVAARAAMAGMVAPYRALVPPPEVRTEDLDAGGVGVRVYRPEATGPHPVILFIHGGGWVVCDLETHDPVCRHLCVGTGMTVISIDYRLAPEHPFPAAIDDCMAVLRWAAANATSLGVDPTRIAVAGDSAGGNLAAALAIRTRDEVGPALAAQLLVYPVIDRPGSHASYAENDAFGLSEAGMQIYWNYYAAPVGHPLAEPIRVALTGLPPAFVLTAQYDVLRDEGEAYAAALAGAGVAVTKTRYPGVIHGFFSLPGLVPAATTAMQDACNWLRARLGRSVEIADLRPEDIEAATVLWARCGLTRPWNDATADAQLALRSPTSAILAGRDGDQLVATVMAGFDGHRAWVYYLAVSPDHRGQGLGRQMMAAAEVWLRAAGAPRLNLMVRADNQAARGFYEALGYKSSDVTVYQRDL